MADYRRLISYIYEYEGKKKGKNVGFAKLEARNGQCRINVNVKRIYMGGNAVGAYLLGTGGRETFLGNLFVRGGNGEFRTNVDVKDVEGTGMGLDTYFGLSVHDVKNSWRCYKTIWEDVLAEEEGSTAKNPVLSVPKFTAEMLPESEKELTPQVVSNVVREIEAEIAKEEKRKEEERRGRENTRKVEREHIKEEKTAHVAELGARSECEEEKQAESAGERVSTEQEIFKEQEIFTEPEPFAGQEPEEKNAEDQANMDENCRPDENETAERSGTEQQLPQIDDPESGVVERPFGGAGTGRSSPVAPQTEAMQSKQETQPIQGAQSMQKPRPMQLAQPMQETQQTQEMQSMQKTQPASSAACSPQKLQSEYSGNSPIHSTKRTVSQPSATRAAGRNAANRPSPMVSPELENPEVLRYLQETEDPAADPEKLWEELRKNYPKIQPFEYEDGCDILTIRPQDIGKLPRESWVYGNNSFLLHGYYNFRYLILVKLGGNKKKARYLLGVPGHYYSSEKYMATMFGFPNFVLSRRQPVGDGRFGYWYTDLRIR